MAMGRWEIKAKLPFGAQARIARKLSKSDSHVSHVLRGERRDRAVEVAVARALKMRRADVFPIARDAA